MTSPSAPPRGLGATRNTIKSRVAKSRGFGVEKLKRVLSSENNNNIGRHSRSSPSPPPPPPLPAANKKSSTTTSGSTSNRSGNYSNRQSKSSSTSGAVSSSASRRQLPVDSQTLRSSTISNSNTANANSKKTDNSPSEDNMTTDKLTAIHNVYGPSANIYTDVLKVSPTAAPSEIREAFFCLRYDVYQKLEGKASGGSATNSGSGLTADALTSDERKEIETKMDAITGAFHILSDTSRRKAYDVSLQEAQPMDISDAEMVADNNYNPSNSSSPSSPSKLSAPKGDTHLPIGQRRSVFRRNRIRSSTGRHASGINEGRRVVATEVGGGLNRRPVPVADSSSDSIFSEDDLNKNSWSADFGRNSMFQNSSRSSPPVKDARDDTLPADVDGLNAREQMLYKNQLQLSQQKQSNATPNNKGSSRLGSRYNNNRGDKYADANIDVDTEEESSPGKLTSPKGVDDFDKSNSWSQKLKNSDRPSPTTTFESEAASVVSKDDSTRVSSTYDDDSQTYDDTTYADETYADETYADETTLGETIDETTVGDSTWASYDDETAYSEEEGGGKYSPGHKKGTKPAPILKSGLKKKGAKRSDSENSGRRVTIHSHRGKGEKDDEDFNIFDGAMCPIGPTLTSITDEVAGTYHDFTQALHQVGTSFIISPDDIDRMADKIRDAKIELGENYAKQMTDRKLDNGPESRSQGKGKSKKSKLKKTLSS